MQSILVGGRGVAVGRGGLGIVRGRGFLRGFVRLVLVGELLVGELLVARLCSCCVVKETARLMTHLDSLFHSLVVVAVTTEVGGGAT